MSSQKERSRGKLFENKDKKKPSQPDMQGDGQIAGKPYAITAWERNSQLVLSIAPPREGTNTYPPEEFRGTLDPTNRGQRKAHDGAVWVGGIQGDEGSYDVRAFQKEGKSGAYLTLELVPSVVG